MYIINLVKFIGRGCNYTKGSLCTVPQEIHEGVLIPRAQYCNGHLMPLVTGSAELCRNIIRVAWY